MINKSIITFLLYILLSSCQLSNLAGDKSNFTKSEKPSPDEGIAVFIFKSGNKSPLPSRVSYFSKTDKDIKGHFALAGFFNKSSAERYILLKKGVYQFSSMNFFQNGQDYSYSFPANYFKIDSSVINFIGEIIITRTRQGISLEVVDNMEGNMLNFYKQYPDHSVKYPLEKKLLKVYDPFKDKRFFK